MIFWIRNQFGLANLIGMVNQKHLALVMSSGTNEGCVDSSSSGMNGASVDSVGTGSYDTSVSADGGSNASTADPQSSTGLSIVGVVMSSCYATSNGGEPDGLIIFFKKDAIPYTKVEKNAQMTYRTISKKNATNSKRILIVPDGDSYTKIKKILCKNSRVTRCDNLEILKRLLENNEQ